MSPLKQTLLYKFGALGEVLISQRKWIFNLLRYLFNSHLKLVVDELMELCQESFSHELILWAIWKLQQYRFFCNFKKTRCCNFSSPWTRFLLHLYSVSDDTICKRWGVGCVNKLLTNHHLFVVKFWRYTFSSLLGILKSQCGFSFLTCRYTLVVIILLLQQTLASRNFCGLVSLNEF